MDWGLALSIGIFVGAVVNTIGTYRYCIKRADEIERLREFLKAKDRLHLAYLIWCNDNDMIPNSESLINCLKRAREMKKGDEAE